MWRYRFSSRNAIGSNINVDGWVQHTNNTREHYYTTREIRVKRQCFTGRTAIRSDQGFTLIELLIVIAIIALLAGLLLPALSGARQRALSAVCMSQMHQLQIAFQMYAHDNQDVVPKCSGAGFQGQHLRVQRAKHDRRLSSHLESYKQSSNGRK